MFFVVTGLQANVTNLGPNGWLVLLGVLLVAIVGKFVGAAGAARLQGLNGRKSRALGVLMNNRGLTELVILTVGVSLKVLDQSLFTILVLMAVVTTIMTGPLLKLVYPSDVLEREIVEAERARWVRSTPTGSWSPWTSPGAATVSIETGAALLARRAPAELVFSRFIESGRPLEVASGLTLDLAQVASGLAEMQSLAKSLEVRGRYRRGAVSLHRGSGAVAATQAEAIGATCCSCRRTWSHVLPRSAASDRLAQAVDAPRSDAVSDPGGAGIRHGTDRGGPYWGRGATATSPWSSRVRVADGLGGKLSWRPDRRRVGDWSTWPASCLRRDWMSGCQAGERVGAGSERCRWGLDLRPVSSLVARSRRHRSGGPGPRRDARGGPVLLVQAGRGESDEGLTRHLCRLRSARDRNDGRVRSQPATDAIAGVMSTSVGPGPSEGEHERETTSIGARETIAVPRQAGTTIAEPEQRMPAVEATSPTSSSPPTIGPIEMVRPPASPSATWSSSRWAGALARSSPSTTCASAEWLPNESGCSRSSTIPGRPTSTSPGSRRSRRGSGCARTRRRVPDCIWGFPSYAFSEAFRAKSLRDFIAPLFQVLTEPIFTDYYTPKAGHVFTMLAGSRTGSATTDGGHRAGPDGAAPRRRWLLHHPHPSERRLADTSGSPTAAGSCTSRWAIPGSSSSPTCRNTASGTTTTSTCHQRL